MLGSDNGNKGRAIAMSVISGALYAISWILFADGAFYAAKLSDGPTYAFRQSTSGLLSTIAFLVLCFVDPNQISSDNDGSYNMMGGGDPATANKNRGIFFFGCLLLFTAVALAIWFLTTDYKDNDWPGVALLLQVFAVAGSSVCLVVSKKVPSPEF